VITIFEAMDKGKFLSPLKEKFSQGSSVSNYKESRLYSLFFDDLILSDVPWQDNYKKIMSVHLKTSHGPLKNWLGEFLNYYQAYCFVNFKFSSKELLFLVNSSFSEFFGNLWDFFHRLNLVKPSQDIFSMNQLVKNPDDFESRLREVLMYPQDWSSISLTPNILDLDLSMMDVWRNETRVSHWRSFLWKELSFTYDSTQPMSLLRITIQFFYYIACTLLIIWSIKSLNEFYENKTIESVSFYEGGVTESKSTLKFKNDNNIARKTVKISSSQLDELEKVQDINTIGSGESDYLPESDMLDTSIRVAGWKNEDEVSGDGDEQDFRDKYFGTAKAYRLMLNSADLFDIRVKLQRVFKSFGVKDAGVPLVGKETLEGVYFNIHIPSKNITNFISELGSVETVNTYISKTSKPPPMGFEKVFIWIKKI
jgi:hypothetical protein